MLVWPSAYIVDQALVWSLRTHCVQYSGGDALPDAAAAAGNIVVIVAAPAPTIEILTKKPGYNTIRSSDLRIFGVHFFHPSMNYPLFFLE